MKKYLLLIPFVTYNSFAETSNIDELQKYSKTLKIEEIQTLMKKKMFQLCVKHPDSSAIYNVNEYCNCASDKMIAEFKGNQIRDLLLPAPYFRYLTKEEMTQKLMKAMGIVLQECPMKFK